MNDAFELRRGRRGRMAGSQNALGAVGAALATEMTIGWRLAFGIRIQ
jgi:hypothetical protein